MEKAKTQKKSEPQLPLSTATEAPAKTPEIVAVEPSEMVTAGITGADVNQELALTRQLDDAAQMERVLEAFKLKTQLIEQARRTAIRATAPEDWVLFKDKAGSINAMLCGPGAQQVAQYYGIQFFNFGPLKNGRFEPDKLTGENGEFAFRGWCQAFSTVTASTVQVEGSRSSSEGFTGRGQFATKLVAESDLRLSVSTLLQTKATRILAAMTRVPLRVLDDAWEGTGKKSDDCRKGSGFGSSAERGATRVADSQAQQGAKELGEEILRRVGGDLDTARQVTKDITSNPPKFAGFDSVKRLTQDWQIENAWKKLRVHEVFGDHAAKSEPGV